ncbi:hypothetical protein KSD_85510 [Ktedonobacter sp. SOSP1-85]|nr:hypothetical protein KSD_85510 [Ktedonobacter sp. SOSP1-85]
MLLPIAKARGPCMAQFLDGERANTTQYANRAGLRVLATGRNELW